MRKIIILLGILLISCSKESNFTESTSNEHQHDLVKKEEGGKVYYTCSMHPEIRQEGPGKCPICHMNLTKVVEDADEEDGKESSENQKLTNLWQCSDYPDVTSEKEDICPIDGSPMIPVKLDSDPKAEIAEVKLRNAQMEHFDPAYFTVTSMKMTKRIRLLGSVLQSEERVSNIPARIPGRVEKVFIKSTGEFVRVGQPVLELYSPQLISSGEEYLLARKSSRENKSKDFKDLLKQSEERLNLWGIKEFQLDRWFKNGKVPRNITIYSPSTGIVQRKNAVVGKYFKEGQNFFELSNLSDVWVQMDVYEHDSALVEMEQSVDLEFTALPGERYTGKLDFISPTLNPKSRTLKVRATISNSSGKIKPGMVADAILTVNLEGEPLVIPRNALIDTGKRKVVWVKVTDKKFKAQIVQTGFESEGFIEIKGGLQEGQKVVIEGNFLLDAQAQLFGGYEDVRN